MSEQNNDQPTGTGHQPDPVTPEQAQASGRYGRFGDGPHDPTDQSSRASGVWSKLNGKARAGLIVAVVAILLAIGVILGMSLNGHSSAGTSNGDADQSAASASASPTWAAEKDEKATKVATDFTNIWFAQIDPIDPSYSYDQWRADLRELMTASMYNDQHARPTTRPGGDVTSVKQKKVIDGAHAIYTVRTTKFKSLDLKIVDEGWTLQVDSIQDSSKSQD